MGIEASLDRTLLKSFQIKASHDPEDAGTTVKSPVEIWVRLVVDVRDGTVGENNLYM